MAAIQIVGGYLTNGYSLQFDVLCSGAELGKSMQIEITSAAEGTYTVRGWDGVPAPERAVVLDHEAPLNQNLTLTVRLDGEVVASLSEIGLAQDPIIIPAASPLITDPIGGAHLPVTILSWPEVTHEQAGHLVEISGAVAPVVIDSLEKSGQSTLTLLHVHDVTTPAGLANRLRESSSLVRVRPSCPTLPSAWVSVRGRARRRFSMAPGSALVDTLTVTHTGQPWPDVQANGATLGDIADNFARLSNLTYLVNLAGIARGGWLP